MVTKKFVDEMKAHTWRQKASDIQIGDTTHTNSIRSTEATQCSRDKGHCKTS